MTDLIYASIAALSERIRTRDLSSVDLLDAVLARIERRRDLNAFITVAAAEARVQAREADREIAAGRYRGPLHGVPFSLKDLIETRGIRTTCGSKVLADHVPAVDATLVERLREAGAVLVGKNALHEFAFGVTNNNPHYGPTRNPWRPDRIPGGSSGGSAAAVAAGMGPASIGTDTGGSVRIPAALCGVVGLKPAFGRVSRAGVFPLSWTLDHPGPITRTVEDAAIVLQAIAGPDPRDPATLGQEVPEFRAALGRSLRGLRLGVLDDPYHRQAAPDVQEAFETALAVLRDLGLRLERVPFPHADEGRIASLAITLAEAASVHERWVRERPGDYGVETLDLLRQGQFVTAPQYLRALKTRGLLLEEVGALMRQVDALVLPTTPIAAPEIGAATLSLGGAAREVRGTLTLFVRVLNLVGLPAISVPCGTAADGLPVGLQIAGRPMDEPTVIAIAGAYERATPWHKARPPEPH